MVFVEVALILSFSPVSRLMSKTASPPEPIKDLRETVSNLLFLKSIFPPLNVRFELKNFALLDSPSRTVPPEI